MNHRPPSSLGRALTVVLGALPFAVITLLVFEDWPPLQRWDQSVAARAAAYGAGHETVSRLRQVVGAVVLPWTSRAVVWWSRLPVAPPGPRPGLLAAGVRSGRSCGLVSSRSTTSSTRPAPATDTGRGRRLVVRLRSSPPLCDGGRPAAWCCRRPGLAAPIPPAGDAADRRGGAAGRVRPGRAERHYVSDVLGGWALGLAILTATSDRIRTPARVAATASSYAVGGTGTTIPPRAAVIVNPIKVGDGVAFRRKVTRALVGPRVRRPAWLETREDDAGNAMAKRAIENGRIWCWSPAATVRSAWSARAGLHRDPGRGDPGGHRQPARRGTCTSRSTWTTRWSGSWTAVTGGSTWSVCAATNWTPTGSR